MTLSRPLVTLMSQWCELGFGQPLTVSESERGSVSVKGVQV